MVELVVITEENNAFVTVSLPDQGMFVRGRRRLFDERAHPGLAVDVRIGKVQPLYNEIMILKRFRQTRAALLPGLPGLSLRTACLFCAAMVWVCPCGCWGSGQYVPGFFKTCSGERIAEVLWIALAYVLGSVPWGLVMLKTFCHLDPRESGSRNTGATNVARLCGFGWGVATLACDVCKRAVPVWLAFSHQSLARICKRGGTGLCAGARFPCFMKFKGGKAVATSIGVFLPLAFWQLLAASALCWPCYLAQRFCFAGLADTGCGSGRGRGCYRPVGLAAAGPVRVRRGGVEA